MKKASALLLTLFLTAALFASSAAADGAAFLGKPFPDFTVTDTEGNAFTLSEQLQDHDAVLIHFWATWCQPCWTKFPCLQEVWEKYGDRVSFIALSSSPWDTMEAVAACREEHGLTFPMGLDEDIALFSSLGLNGLPSTVVVDRFGSAAFYLLHGFRNPAEAERVLQFFLDESYTQTAVLHDIPADRSTRAFPVSGQRAVRVENENVRTYLLHADGLEKPVPCYVIPEGKARLRIEITAADDPARMVYADCWGTPVAVTDLLDPERSAYVYEQAAEAVRDGQPRHYSCGLLTNPEREDSDRISFFLVPDEKYLEELAEALRVSGYENVRWTGPVPAAAGNAAYILHVVDQDNAPVPGVYVNFCTDTACAMRQTDGNGTIVFDGAPDNYHLQLLKVPAGYTADPGFELYTGPDYGEWVLYVWKN